ncbi:hypothetical protein DBV15_10591 [Temnothorax longispinosus]|uniref:Uncharacterized protein n=1 Tax=Temnothorax longispinosus TaxID=300112 RepID=A0A4S2JRH6_9HYME|nr:hypothetical protein DBV15_10591 [Temnothorax longispinosus]
MLWSSGDKTFCSTCPDDSLRRQNENHLYVGGTLRASPIANSSEKRNFNLQKRQSRTHKETFVET